MEACAWPKRTHRIPAHVSERIEDEHAEVHVEDEEGFATEDPELGDIPFGSFE